MAAGDTVLANARKDSGRPHSEAGTTDGMRARYLRVKRTYLVEVPYELPRHRWPSTEWNPAMWQRLALLSGTRFPP